MFTYPLSICPEDKQNQSAGLGLSKQISSKIHLPQTDLSYLDPLVTTTLTQMQKEVICPQ